MYGQLLSVLKKTPFSGNTQTCEVEKKYPGLFSENENTDAYHFTYIIVYSAGTEARGIYKFMYYPIHHRYDTTYIDASSSPRSQSPVELRGQSPRISLPLRLRDSLQTGAHMHVHAKPAV